MKIAALHPTININPHETKIVNFLKIHLNKKDIPFDKIREQLQIKISDKALHRIVIDARYGVIK